jgi:predicted metal-dependent phosphotriesterase family hydrolase
MQYTKENIVEGINAKIDEIFGSDETTRLIGNMYKKTLLSYPKEIEQNVLEWINDDTITEIDYHGISIKELVDDLSLQNAQMPQLFKNFITFRDYNFVDQMLCYRGL